MDTRRIGEILLDRGAVSAHDLDEALRYQAGIGGLIGQALLRTGALAEDTLLAALSKQLDLPVLAAADLPVDLLAYARCATALGLPAAFLIQHDAVLWFAGEKAADSLEAGASADPDAAAAATGPVCCFARAPLDPALRERLDAACASTGFSLQLYLGPNRLLDSALAGLRSAAHRSSSSEDGDDISRLRELAEEAPVIDFVNGMFEDALRQRASDIHVEPFESRFQVRFRIDGVLSTVQTLPRARFDAIASRIKLLSGMDIAERRLPQDGRQSVRFAGEDIDLRVSSLPGAWGESLVLRLLRKRQSLPSLEGLGLVGRTMSTFREIIEEKNGVVLVTGPTGSGKSTTLYRGLELINDGERKIVTIEDPVEYDMEGVTQVQARAEIGYTFARGLRAILRQDPDVIMIGEIRDGETAGIAVQSALTGHLVFSTLHTNSAAGAVERLIDLGVEPFLVSAALRGLIGQRLVRKVCDSCAVPASASDQADGARRLGAARHAGAHIPTSLEPRWREAVGCPDCGGSGYRGRLAVYEILRLTGPIKEAISRRADEESLVKAARADGFLTMFEDGLLKAAAGETSLSEVIRVLGAAEPALAEARL